MTERRRRRGFERAGAFGTQGLGLPAPRARELRLVTAWRACAGGPLAERARALGVRRGVLEVVVEDSRWLATVADLLPSLGARVAERCPDLGIRRCRVVVRGDAGRETPSVPVRAGPPSRGH